MLKLQIGCRIRIRLGSGMINHRGVLFCNTEENFTIKQLWKKVCSLIQEGCLPYCNAKLQVRNLTLEYSYLCADITSNNTRTRHVIFGKTFNHNSFSIISLDGLLVYY